MSETYTPPLSTVSGKDYLEVKHRVYWVRQDHKDAQIITDLVSHDAEHGYAVVKAIITLPATGAIGTGYGMAERGAPGPAAKRYVEFAETRAIGRACAAVGYGTLAALEEDSDPADAPHPTQQAQRAQRVEAPRKMEAVETEWSRAADVAIAHMYRLQVSDDDEKTLIMELTGGKARKLVEMHPSEIHRLSDQLAQYRTPADLSALRAPQRTESHAATPPRPQATPNAPTPIRAASVTAPAGTESAGPGPSTAEQHARIRDLVGPAGMTVDALLQHQGLTSLADMSAAKADRIIARMEAKIAVAAPDPNSPVAETPRLVTTR